MSYSALDDLLPGIGYNIRNKPKLDPDFIPFALLNRGFRQAAGNAGRKIAVAIERERSRTAVFETVIHGTPEKSGTDAYYTERITKMLLWIKGGFRITVCGDRGIYESIRKAYSPAGSRAFDSGFMSRVYERPFEVIYREYDEKPMANEDPQPLGRHLEGCRIGFDAGGSDRKVSAVIDGVPVFSEEVIWHPKLNADPEYHFKEIVAAFRSAAAHLPVIDAIGISSAGIFIENRTMVASLFLKVPPDLFDKKVKDIYIRAAKEIADVPVVVCNDGDVSALAGGMNLNVNSILGIAMGTSEAGGFLDENGCITGWLNELAFVPVDAQPGAPADEWSGDIGCGVKYFSQDAVIRLAAAAGITLDGRLTPAEKLLAVQEMAANGTESEKAAARSIYETIGTYLGHTAALYYDVYKCRNILLLGRVMSGTGGEMILGEARRVLTDEYGGDHQNKGTGGDIPNLFLPDEKARRIGQSVAAASLPGSRRTSIDQTAEEA